jgi:hypothetical protein
MPLSLEEALGLAAAAKSQLTEQAHSAVLIEQQTPKADPVAPSEKKQEFPEPDQRLRSRPLQT